MYVAFNFNDGPCSDLVDVRLCSPRSQKLEQRGATKVFLKIKKSARSGLVMMTVRGGSLRLLRVNRTSQTFKAQ
jgi:hypothetical protein